jgi:hypothetical protein
MFPSMIHLRMDLRARRSTVHIIHKCGCYISFSVKEYADRIVLLQSGNHTPESHLHGLGILSVKQRGAVERAARSAPMSVGSQVHASLQNFSPGRRIPYDARYREAVARIVRRKRAEVMSAHAPGITLDGSEGSMNTLYGSISLVNLLKRHNDPTDSYHMDGHEVVCDGYQFGLGVRFMCLTTPHFLLNMARTRIVGGRPRAISTLFRV